MNADCLRTPRPSSTPPPVVRETVFELCQSVEDEAVSTAPATPVPRFGFKGKGLQSHGCQLLLDCQFGSSTLNTANVWRLSNRKQLNVWWELYPLLPTTNRKYLNV